MKREQQTVEQCVCACAMAMANKSDAHSHPAHPDRVGHSTTPLTTHTNER